MNKFIKLKPYFPVFGNSNIWLQLLVSQPKNYQSFSNGITLAELLVAMVVAGIILQLAFLGFSWNRQLYLNDVARNDASQTFKTAFDLVGSDIKQAGAGLDASFPAVLISPYPTSAGTPNLISPTFPTFNSEITLRRLILSQKLPICRAVTSGSKTEIFVVDKTVSGCDVTDNDGWPDNLKAWKDYRTNNSGTIRAFIYNGSGQGEFLNYTSEKTYNNSNTLITPIANPSTPATTVNSASLVVNGTLANSYSAGSAAQFLVIEERKYRLGCSDSSIADAVCPADKLQNLQLIVNNGTPVNLVNKIGNFAVTATIQQDITSTTTAQFLCWSITQTRTTTCSNNPPPTSPATASVTGYAWSQIYSINVTLKAQPVSRTGPLLSSYTQDKLNNIQETQNFLPRNVLNY